MLCFSLFCCLDMLVVLRGKEGLDKLWFTFVVSFKLERMPPALKLFLVFPVKPLLGGFNLKTGCTFGSFWYSTLPLSLSPAYLTSF